LFLSKITKRLSWYEIALIVAVMAVHLFAATSDAFNFPANWFTRDDAYYYFKVAQNISEGRGSTLDGLSPTNGYHPLWMLVNIPIFALARFDLILPLRLLLLVQAALSAATAVLIYRLVKSALSPPLAVLASAWWAFNLYIHATLYQFGLETGLASFTAILLIYQLWKFELRWRKNPVTPRQIAGLAILATLTLFSRLDLVFLAVLAGAWIILRGTRLRTLLPLDMLLAAVSVLTSFIYRLSLPEYYLYTQAAILMIIVSVATKILLYFFLGLDQPPATESFWRSLRQILIAVTASTLITSAVMLAASSYIGSFPRITLIYDAAINLLGMIALRSLARIFSQNTDRESIPPLDFLKSKWRGWLREGAIFYGILGGALGLYLLANKIFIGSAMPVSGEIKHWWSTFGARVYGGSAHNPLSFWGLDIQNDFNALRPFSTWLGTVADKLAYLRGDYRNDDYYISLLIAVFLLWLIVLLLHRRQAVRVATQFSLPILLAASILQVLSYNLTGYAGIKEWYWISQPLLLVLAFCLAGGILVRPFQKYPAARVAQWILVAAILLPQAWNFTAVMVARMPHGVYGPDLPYLDSVRFLEERTPPGAMIGMTGGGNVAYYIQDRTLVNLDGLINSPAYFAALQAGQANQYLAGIGLDYVFANPGILKALPYQGQIGTGAVIARYGGKSLMEFKP